MMLSPSILASSCGAWNPIEFALQLDADDAVTLNNLGCQLNTAGSYRDVLRWLDHALELEPRMSEARFNRGQAFYRLGRIRGGCCRLCRGRSTVAVAI
jgi:lipoprotein NlpI